MPSIITHYRFAKYNLDRSMYKRLGNVGSQGPDVFFFYGIHPPRKNAKEVRKFGVFLHDIDMADGYIYLINYALNHEADRDLLFHFIKGFIAHYLLDRNTHPYIFYRTNLPQTKKSKAKDEALSHSAFETSIDTYYALRCNLDHNTVKLLSAKSFEVKIVSKMIYMMAKDVYHNPYIKENTYYNAWKDMKVLEGVFNSRFGIKKFFFKHLFKHSMLNVMSHPYSVTYNNVDIDFMNFERNVWLHPVTGEKHYDTFYDLYQKSESELSAFNFILDNIAITPNWPDLIKKMTHNIDHRGVEVGSKMVYFANCWKVKRNKYKKKYNE